jgi:phosphoglycolate phosphatase-like HAD superfamily hydrolase
MNRIKLIAFDLDGTLCNTLRDIASSLNLALAHFGFPTYSDREVSGLVGKSVVYMCKNAVPKGHEDDWQQLVQLIDGIYTGFTEKLYGLYKLSQQDYYVSLLIKARMQPKEIATLTAHSKESVASTRSRLYQKVFGKKGSSRQWDDFILSL